NARSYLDDLEVALVLMANLSRYFTRLEDKKKTNLLQTIFKKIVVDGNGDIISFELHSPFTYLFTLASRMNSKSEEGCGSSQVSFRPLLKKARKLINVYPKHTQNIWTISIHFGII
ncbi:MAG: hypothetical protein JXA78_19660, partial [Anaerolineales bacterium]|nr:hypothetical protein [Anaerolineales bacterium]